MHSSSLRIAAETKGRLDRLRVHPKESYNAIIDRLIESYTDPEPLSPEEIRGIEDALEELKQGKFSTHEQVKKELGIS